MGGQKRKPTTLGGAAAGEPAASKPRKVDKSLASKVQQKIKESCKILSHEEIDVITDSVTKRTLRQQIELDLSRRHNGDQCKKTHTCTHNSLVNTKHAMLLFSFACPRRQVCEVWQALLREALQPIFFCTGLVHQVGGHRRGEEGGFATCCPQGVRVKKT